MSLLIAIGRVYLNLEENISSDSRLYLEVDLKKSNNLPRTRETARFLRHRWRIKIFKFQVKRFSSDVFSN